MLTWLRMLAAGQRRRLALAVGALTVVAALVGMHQISVDHTLVTARPAASTHRLAVDGASLSSWSQAGEAMHAHPAEAGQPSVGEADGDCDSGCHDPGAMTACLLALTLAVVARLLRLPGARWLPFQRRSRMLASAGRSGWRWRPALNLAELCVCRT
jgi:hypothetical protein